MEIHAITPYFMGIFRNESKSHLPWGRLLFLFIETELKQRL